MSRARKLRYYRQELWQDALSKLGRYYHIDEDLERYLETPLDASSLVMMQYAVVRAIHKLGERNVPASRFLADTWSRYVKSGRD